MSGIGGTAGMSGTGGGAGTSGTGGMSGIGGGAGTSGTGGGAGRSAYAGLALYPSAAIPIPTTTPHLMTNRVNFISTPFRVTRDHCVWS